jgi:hypothetical protein
MTRPGSTDLTSYYIYDQPVLAPADGTVTYVLDGHPDQPIGSVDERHPSGNQLVIDIEPAPWRRHSPDPMTGSRARFGSPGPDVSASRQLYAGR